MNNKDVTTKPEFTYAALRIPLGSDADDIASSLIGFIHDIFAEANLEKLGYELIEMDEADLDNDDNQEFAYFKNEGWTNLLAFRKTNL